MQYKCVLRRELTRPPLTLVHKFQLAQMLVASVQPHIESVLPPCGGLNRRGHDESVRLH